MHWFIDPIQNHYADFDGRATRQQYGMYTLWYILVYIVVSILASIIQMELLAMLFSLALLIPSLAISVRRIHDLGKSGWWAMMFLIPFLNLALWLGLLIRKGDVGANQYGQGVGSDSIMAPDLSDAPRPEQTDTTSVSTPPETNQGQ